MTYYSGWDMHKSFSVFVEMTDEGVIEGPLAWITKPTNLPSRLIFKTTRIGGETRKKIGVGKGGSKKVRSESHLVFPFKTAYIGTRDENSKRKFSSCNRPAKGNEKYMNKISKITYWFATVVLSFGLLASGIQQLVRVEAEGALAPPFAWGIGQLGYPLYFLTILGIWKILGAIAILIPKYPLLKEWAYAGIFFLFTGALYSHIASGHPKYELLPATILLILTILSWYFRPADRFIRP